MIIIGKNNSAGRPRINVEVSQLIAKYSEVGNWSLVASAFGISRSTVMSRLKDAKAKKIYHL